MKKPSQFRPRRGMRFSRDPHAASFTAGNLRGSDGDLALPQGSVLTSIGVQGCDEIVTQSEAPQAAASIIWSVDTDALKGVPANSAEWDALLTSLSIASGVPSNLYLFQEGASPIDDKIGSKDLTGAGTLTFSDPVSGWDALSVKTTAATIGTMTNTTFTNVNAESKLVLLYALIATAGTGGGGNNRTVMRFGDLFGDDAVIETSNSDGFTPRLVVGEGDGSLSTSTQDPTAVVRPIVLRINDTANTVDGFNDLEKIIGGTQACNGTELCFGGDNSQTWLPATVNYIYAAVFTGTAAELTNTQIKVILETLGWTVAWSP